MRSPDSSPKLPLAPLARVLRYAVSLDPAWGPREGGAKHLARLYAFRYGVKVNTADRLLWRILDGANRNVRLEIADQWLTLIGSHLSFVYPELYEEAA